MENLDFKNSPQEEERDEAEFEIEEIKGEIDSAVRDLAIDCIYDANPGSLGGLLSPKVCVQTLESHAKDENQIFLIARSAGRAVGIFLGVKTNYPFSEIPVAYDNYFRIRPEFRGRGIWQAMVSRFEDWARQKGCKCVILAVNQFSVKDPEPAKKRLFKDGFKLFSTEFYKVI